MDAKLHYIKIGKDGVPEVKLQVGDETILLHTDPVNAVEVVRCKDCKHYMTIHCTCDGCCISDDWYCADGERKDNVE